MEGNFLNEAMVKLEELHRAGRHEEIVKFVENCLERCPPHPLLNLYLGAPLIDCGSDMKRRDLSERGVGLLEEALDELQADESLPVPPRFEAQVRYNLSNGYADLARRMREAGETHSATQADQDRRRHLHFAAMVAVVNEDDVPDEISARTLVNYAILLNEQGRHVEAIDFCIDCLRQSPNHPMASGTLGVGFMRLSHYDQRYRPFHLALAWNYLQTAIAEPSRLYAVAGKKEEEHFRAQIEWLRDQIDGLIDDSSEDIQEWSERVLQNHDTGNVPEWLAQWADDRLLLSFGPGMISCSRHFADDALIPEPRFPARSTPSEKEAKFFLDSLNQIKEEYATARHLYYLALSVDAELDERDRRIDYAFGYEPRVFGLRTGLLKASFRQAHDILDKIAVCLNLYFDLPRKRKDVYFNNVLLDPDNMPDLLPKIADRIETNPMLKALYDFGLDWFNGRFPGPLKKHRNAATHRGLALGRERLTPEQEDDLDGAMASVRQFRRRTYLLLRMIRAAILYFMGSVIHIENTEVDEAETSSPLVEFEVGVMVPPTVPDHEPVTNDEAKKEKKEKAKEAGSQDEHDEEAS